MAGPSQPTSSQAGHPRQHAPGRHPRTILERLPRLVLASQSPRRRQLLTEAGLDHEAVHPGVDDGILQPGLVTPEQWVRSLAYLKAAAGARLSHHGDQPRLIIAADTVCVKNGEILSHPSDGADAARMLRAFRNGSHRVLTGVALLPMTRGSADPLDRVLVLDAAEVHWGDVSDQQIEQYVAGEGWRGKAGGYNLYERIDDGWPIRFDGDPTTIMGLPMRVLLLELERLAHRHEGPPPR